MNKKILVIDDESLVAKSLQGMLNRKGYDVAVASSAKEALDRVNEVDFGLIISDIRMPEADGIQAIKSIREHLKGKGKKTTPEILITGYADEQSYRSALDLNVTDYIYKPFDADEFLQVIETKLK